MNFYILAGGQSKRFGQDKALIALNEQSIIENVIAAVPAKRESIKIVTNSFEAYGFLELEMIPDVFPGLGPIGGVHAGLLDSSFPFNFFLACDLPLISTDVIQTVLDAHSGQDIFAARTENGLEPMCAIYSKKCVPPIEKLMQIKSYSLHGLINSMSSGYTEIENSQLLFNLNTVRDLESLNQLRKIKQ